MKIQLKYGRDTLSFDLPDGAHVETIIPAQIDAPPAGDLIRRALADPIESSRLVDIARAKKRIALVTSDKTRATRTADFLPFVLNELEQAGVSDEHITIILATGSHEGHTLEEINQVLGPGVRSRYRVIDHDGEDADSHTDVGTTTRGTPLRFQREVVESDCVILTGAIGFHYFAGFGGGRKALLPGVAHVDTILANHRLMLVPEEPDSPIHPMVANGILEGNPIHEDMMEGTGKLGPAFLLNTILGPDGRIVDVVAGDPWKAFETGTARVRSLFGVPVEKRAKLVIASCGGHPKDLNFIQVHKSFHHAFDWVDDGGVLILLGDCSQGIGSDDLMGWFTSLDLRAFGERIFRDFTINAHTAYVSMRKALTRRVVFLTSLPKETVETMGMVWADSPERAVRDAEAHLGRIDDVVVMPIASVTVPQ